MSEKNQEQGNSPKEWRREVEVDTLLLGNDKNNAIDNCPIMILSLLFLVFKLQV